VCTRGPAAALEAWKLDTVLSPPLQDLLARMLVVEPISRRLTPKAVREHPWMRAHISSSLKAFQAEADATAAAAAAALAAASAALSSLPLSREPSK
jgi:hypothetical protein